MPGAPNIYYGTEIGLTGSGDPDCRRAFPWEDGQWNHDLLAFTRRAIALRRAHPALRRGNFELLHANADLCAFGRRDGHEALVIAFNAGRADGSLSLDVSNLLPDGTYQDLWNGIPGRVVRGVLRKFTLPSRNAAVFGA
jgi:neopullulanase